MLQVATFMTMYESIMRSLNRTHTTCEFLRNRRKYTLLSAAVTGGLVSVLFNPIDVLIVNKQANPNESFQSIYTRLHK